MESVFLLNGQYFKTEHVTESEEIDLFVPTVHCGNPFRVRFYGVRLHLPSIERVVYVAEIPEDELVELILPVYVEEGT